MAGEGTFNLSEQQQVSCNTSMYGCGGGNATALRYWETKGPMEESCTGYPSTNGSSYACAQMSACSLLDYRTKEYYTVDTSDVNEIKTSLNTDGPAYFRYLVYNDFYTFWGTYSPGTVYTQQTGAYVGGHAVLLIGWDDTKQAWLLKNSWGATGGPNGDGTFWMSYTGHANDRSDGPDDGFGDFAVGQVRLAEELGGSVEIIQCLQQVRVPVGDEGHDAGKSVEETEGSVGPSLHAYLVPKPGIAQVAGNHLGGAVVTISEVVEVGALADEIDLGRNGEALESVRTI